MITITTLILSYTIFLLLLFVGAALLFWYQDQDKTWTLPKAQLFQCKKCFLVFLYKEQDGMSPVDKGQSQSHICCPQCNSRLVGRYQQTKSAHAPRWHKLKAFYRNRPKPAEDQSSSATP